MGDRSGINEFKCKGGRSENSSSFNRRAKGARIQMRDGDMLAIVRIGVRSKLYRAGAGNKIQVGMRRNKQ